MSGSVLVVVIVVAAGVLYLLLRRRGARRSEEIRPLPQQGTDRPMTDGPVESRPAGRDGGSSHPGYPVAPAKYAGAAPVKVEASGQHATYGGGTVSRPELDPVAEARKAANAPAPTKPWYPEAPANYAEEEPGKTDERG